MKRRQGRSPLLAKISVFTFSLKPKILCLKPMLNLDQNSIKLGAAATDKTDAIRQAGTLLVDSGHMEPDYITSMMGREKVANTYLGNGIAIPHGLPKDRDLILETGISVVQIPSGVEWNPGETVYLVVGIAAKSDEHIEILSNLTYVLDDEAVVQKLAKTSNANDIIQCLTNRSPQATPTPAAETDFARFVDYEFQEKRGFMPDLQRF